MRVDNYLVGVPQAGGVIVGQGRRVKTGDKFAVMPKLNENGVIRCRSI